MKKDIKLNEFLMLAGALEKDIITKEQFCILSDMSDFSRVDAILKIMEIPEVADKDQIFEKILLKNNISLFLRTLENVEIFKNDATLQKFLFDNLDNPVMPSLVNLIQYGWFNDDVFLNRMLKLGLEKDFNKISCISTISVIVANDIKHRRAFYDDPIYQNLSKKVFEIEEDSYLASDYLHLIFIDGIEKYSRLHDYIIKFYNTFHQPLCGVFESLANKNQLDRVIAKVEEIDKEDILDINKQKRISKFISNLMFFENEDGLKRYNDESFNILVNLAYDNICFGVMKAIIDNELENDRLSSFEDIIEIRNKFAKINEDHIRGILLKYYLSQGGNISDEIFEKLSRCDYYTAMEVITTDAIESGNEEYINEGRHIFKENFSPDFIDYINEFDFNKQQILAIRDAIINRPLIFEDRKFIVDTKDIVSNYQFVKKKI